MAKKDTFLRYMLIISKLRKKNSTFEEIRQYLLDESEYKGFNLDISKRTFQRDIQEIGSLFDIEIKYNRTVGVYYIEYDESDRNKERIIEALDVFHALNMSDRLGNHIQFENSHSQGTHHLYGLIHAIKNNYQIELYHQKYWDTVASKKTVEPLAIKEFRRRWYLVANEQNGRKIKVYGLDRIQLFNVLQARFEPHKNFSIHRHFEHCFGIIKPEDGEPETIELSFTPGQGEYIESLPLHHSQKVIISNDDELRISLKLFITHDLIMELLSYGDTMMVVKPATLAKRISEIQGEAAEKNGGFNKKSP